MVDIRILSGKDQLEYLAKLAVKCQARNESFTDAEVIALFGGIQSVFGDQEASGFLNEVLKVQAAHKGRMTFNRAVVETVSTKAEEGFERRFHGPKKN